MPIKIVSPEITHRYETEGSFLIYKKLNFLEQKRLLYKHMSNGVIPEEESLELGYEVMEAMIVGWEGVVDDNDKSVKFSSEYISALPALTVMAFLEEVIMPEFVDMAGSVTDKKGKKREKEIKN
jgi:hypothetical protein|tara:strand:- start:3187 stop:3558 length:372 start_codon:yes stop_codon:yes gene_type:complete